MLAGILKLVVVGQHVDRRRGGRLATLSDDQRRWSARAWLAALGNPAVAIDAPPLQVA